MEEKDIEKEIDREREDRERERERERGGGVELGINRLTFAHAISIVKFET